MTSSNIRILFSILAVVIIQTVKSSPERDLNYRLNDIIIPSHYDIELKTYLLQNFHHPEKRFTFEGTTKITLSTKSKHLDKIILNAKNLTISRIHLKLDAQNAPEIDAHISKYSNATEKITVSLKKYLESGRNYTLELIYTGKMQSQTFGFYLSSYENEENDIIHIGATRFYPNYARMVFPCFDEPKFKATFNLRINRENGYYTSSNTKLSHIIPIQEQRSIDVFKITPLMSTFGLAFMISDFRSRKPVYGEISVLAPPKDYLKTGFATDVAPQILQKLNEYTEIPYSSAVNTEKLDLISFPDHSNKGLSHFGFISFKEDKIINNLKEKDVANLGNTIKNIAHEMAHLWFGNLVTPEWWTYNWLSEGLAVYIGSIVANEAFPEYDFDQRFTLKVIQYGLMRDGWPSNPLVNKSVENVLDKRHNFNAVINLKGPALFSMIAHMMGAKWFKIAIQKYLRKNLYKTVTNENLLEILRDDWRDHDLNVRTFLADWTEQPGYPIVTVHLSDDGKSMSVSQKRFLVNPESDADKSIQYTIPFTYTTNIENDFENTKTKKYLRKNIHETIHLNHKAHWVVANLQLAGFYRVNYDERNWLNLMAALKSENFGGIHVKNRAQIVDDLLSYIHSGHLDYKLIFEILEYLQKEEEYLPWQQFNWRVTDIYVRLGAEERGWFRNYELSIVSHVYDKLGFHDREDDIPLDIYNRVQIREIACRTGHSNCILNAKDVFDDEIYNKKLIPQSMRNVVFCTAVREYGEIYFNYLWGLYKSIPNEESQDAFKYELVSGLACSRKKDEIYKLLDYIWQEEKRYKVIFEIGNNYENPDDIIQYFLDHKELIAEKKNFRDVQHFFQLFGKTDAHLDIFTEIGNDIEEDPIVNEYTINEFSNFFQTRMINEKNRHTDFLQYLEQTHSGGLIFAMNNILIIILLIIQMLYYLK